MPRYNFLSTKYLGQPRKDKETKMMNFRQEQIAIKNLKVIKKKHTKIRKNMKKKFREKKQKIRKTKGKG